MSHRIAAKSYPPEFIGPTLTREQYRSCYRREYQRLNKAVIIAKAIANADERNAKQRAKYADPEYRKLKNAQNREHYYKNKSAYLARGNAYVRRRSKEDPEYALRRRLRSRILEALRDQKAIKGESTLKLLGCTLAELRAHLEKQFKPGMTWENRGYRGWHVDHIKPCALFDLTKLVEQRACFHYTNLQPMWRKDNQLKGDRWEEAA